MRMFLFSVRFVVHRTSTTTSTTKNHLAAVCKDASSRLDLCHTKVGSDEDNGMYGSPCKIVVHSGMWKLYLILMTPEELAPVTDC
jgi:hypothetical protein